MTLKNEYYKKMKHKPDEKLTAKESLFIKYYNENGNCGAAAVRSAGYDLASPRQFARELLQKPHIKRNIITTQMKVADMNIVGQGEVIDMLLDVALTNESSNPAITLQALEKIQKSMGMFTDKQEITSINETKLTLNIDDAENYLKEMGINIDDL